MHTHIHSLTDATGDATRARACRVHYTGYSDYFDEIRLMCNLRKYEPTLHAEAALTETDMVVGGKVAVLWGGQGPSKDAFEAKIVEICRGPFVQVRFQGYGEAWDRWYSPDDLRVEEMNGVNGVKGKGKTKSLLSKDSNKNKGKGKGQGQ